MSYDPTFQIDLPIDVALATAIRAKIRAWITSRWLTDLISVFGGQTPLRGSTDEILGVLETFSERWDYRRIARERGAATDDALRQGQGSARWLSATTDLPHEIEMRIIDNADHLGLVQGHKPSRSSYDYIVVLGGARLSCKLRPDLAAEVMRGGTHTDNVVLLGAARPVADSERDATDTYASGAADEFDLIIAGAQHAFGFDKTTYQEVRHDDHDNHNLSWVVKRFTTLFENRELNLSAMSAPSSDPLHRRANSADTLVFFLDREDVRPESTLLLITSQIYVPYTQLEALRTIALPRRLLVETI
ncbi:MAG TPA: hypothetical protein VGR71_03290, partial [Nitrospira sp.]|nr:hypothetical protein [Nitrospira sp.]